MTRIGFIGLGNMGLPMAINLCKAGHTVTGFDLRPEACDAFKNAGGIVATKLAEAAQNQAVIITMLQTGAQVRHVCLTNDGLFQNAAAHALYIDCSSIDIETTRNISREASQRSIVSVDAPVSGGVAGAEAGSLTIMIGGEKEAFLQAKQILASIGKKIFHAGASGSGQAAKICNNMLLGITMIGVAETFSLGEKMGLTPKKLWDVIHNASGQSWVIDHYMPVPDVIENVPANHAYRPGFTTAMMLKDLRLGQDAATLLGIDTTLGALATQLYQTWNDNGNESLDFSSIIEMIGEA